MAKVLVPLAQGCEELEAVTIIDVLRRAGIQVVSAGLDDHAVTCSRRTVLVPDTTLERALHDEYDMVVLPGGQPGADNLEKDVRLISLLQKMAAAQKFTAAICAAPKVLARAGLLNGKRATAFPGTLEKLQLNNVTLEHAPVVRDGFVITSRGPGTAMDFSLMLVEILVGKDQRVEVESGLQRPH